VLSVNKIIGTCSSTTRLSTAAGSSGSESVRTPDSNFTRTPGGSDQNYGSVGRRRVRTYNSARVNGSARRSSRPEPRASPNESSEWQVIYTHAQTFNSRFPLYVIFAYSVTGCFKNENCTQYNI